MASHNNMSEPSDNKTPRHWLLACMLVLVTAAVHGSVCGFEFLDWDDDKHVVDNRLVDPPSGEGLRRIWREPYWGLYVPLTYSFFSVEAAIARRPVEGSAVGEVNPAVFHTGSLALHIACTLLVFVLLRRLFGNDWAGTAGALLFALHPLQVESVAWISETRGLLCAMFSLLAIFEYVRWRETLDESSATDSTDAKPSYYKYYASATLASVAALLCKPTAVAVPLVVGVIAIGLLRQRPSSALAALAPWFAISLVFVVITKNLQPNAEIVGTASYWARPLIAGDALAFYMCKLVAPLWLGADYGRTPTWVMSQWTFYAAFLMPAALIAGVCCLKSRRICLIGIGVFAGWLLPVLGLIPFKFQHISTVADRYVYLAMLGPALVLGWYLSKPRPRAAVAAVVAVLFLLAGLSFHQTSHWRDNRAFLKNTLAVNPRSVVGQQLSGHLLAQEGKHEEAIKLYRLALREHPRQETLHWNLVVSLAALDRDDEALAAARAGVEKLPNRPLLKCQLALLLKERGEIRRATELYEKALEIDPDCGSANLALGKIMEDRGQLEEAAGFYRAALRTRPDWTTALFNLGNVYRLRPGGLRQAEHCYREALESDPGYVPAHVNLADVLWRQGRADEAREHYREILRLVPSNSPYAKGASDALRELDAGQ